MISAALNAHAARSKRVWAQDRAQTLGASEVGGCARRGFFEKNEADAVYGIPRDADYEDGWGAKMRGTVYEDAWWAPAIKAAYGENALYVGVEQRTFVLGFSSGTPDGLLVNQPSNALAHLGVPDIESDGIVLDCKSIDPRSRLDGAKDEHVFQVITNIGLIRELTPWKPTYGLLSYTDASFWDETKEFPIRFDPAVFEESKRRSRDVMLATAADQLRPEGVIAGGKECENCGFTRACGQVRAARVPKDEAPIDPLMAETIADLARRATEAEEREKAFAAEARELKEELREMLAQAGTRKLEADGVRVKWSPVKGRAGWDNAGIRAAAEQAGVKIAEFARSGDPSDKLTITLQEIPIAAAPGETAASAA